MGGREFPKPIIQRIQSLLTGEEAARTAIVSKSWHSAWSTRPILELDDIHFKEIREFSKYATTTIKRYQHSNLKIESFKLHMDIACFGSADLAERLIAKALKKLGATRLTFRQNYCTTSRYSFSHEVLLGEDNLVELTVEGCKINLDAGFVIKCRMLESLCLDKVCSDTVAKIILSCPLIENLSLFNVDCNSQRDEWDWEAVQVQDPPTVDNLQRLRRLVLCYKSFKTLFPGDLLSKFPLLSDFALRVEPGTIVREGVQIANCGLEHLKLEMIDIGYEDYDDGGRLEVNLDVPCIRTFTFEGGDRIPLLSFVSTSSPSLWESSHVSIKHDNGFSESWFRELDEFLFQLRQSKIHLSLSVRCSEGIDYMAGNLRFAHKHELESLAIDMTGLPSFNCYALFDGLFRLCRPKLITQLNPCKDWDEYSNHRRGTRKTNNMDFIRQELEQGMLVKVSTPTQLMYGLNDLEEVNAQIFDIVDDVPDWRPIPLNSSFDDEHRHRFLLKWKP